MHPYPISMSRCTPDRWINVRQLDVLACVRQLPNVSVTYSDVAGVREYS